MDSLMENEVRPAAWKTYEKYGACLKTHKMYRCYSQQKNQAQWRGEVWEISFDDYRTAWWDKWENRGRKAHNYVMFRLDITEPWTMDNTTIISKSSQQAHVAGVINGT